MAESPHSLRKQGGPEAREPNLIYQGSFSLAAGETLHFAYSFAAEVPLDGLETRTLASAPDSSPPVELEFKTARIRVHRGGERPELGLRVRRQEIEPAPAR